MSTNKFPIIDSFNPIECISSKVLRVNRITANVFRKHLKPYGVTDSQLTVLFVLSKKDGATQQQLSEMARLEKSTMSRNLQRLFDRDYISKEDFPVLRITDKGLSLVNDIIPAWDNAMNEMRALLDDEGVDALNLVLSKLLVK